MEKRNPRRERTDVHPPRLHPQGVNLPTRASGSAAVAVLAQSKIPSRRRRPGMGTAVELCGAVLPLCRFTLCGTSRFFCFDHALVQFAQINSVVAGNLAPALAAVMGRKYF